MSETWKEIFKPTYIGFKMFFQSLFFFSCMIVLLTITFSPIYIIALIMYVLKQSEAFSEEMLINFSYGCVIFAKIYLYSWMIMVIGIGIHLFKKEMKKKKRKKK